MMETLEELTYNYEEDGTLVRKEIERVVLSKGSWPTMMFLFQELDRKTGEFRSPKMAIVRFQKRRGGYRRLASLNISDEKQARQIMTVFENWTPKLRAAATLAAAEDDVATNAADNRDEGWDPDRGGDRDKATADAAEDGGGI
jgi:hypothetical protein